MKKEKLILAAILFLISLFASVIISGGISLFISKEWEGFHQLADIGTLLERVTSGQAGTLFLCVEGFLCALILMMMVMGKSHEVYESPMRSITDKIKTPVPAGQNQHGSSKWLERAAYRRAFGAYELDPKHLQIAGLLRQGRDDLQFIKKREEST